MSVTFTVPGEPFAWKRPAGNGKRRYTPTAMADAKRVVAQMARLACRNPLPKEAPVIIEYSFYMRPPKRINYETRPYPLKVPDIDNLEKLISDAMNTIAYHDDCQIVDSITRKRWAKDGKPRVEVTVRQKEVARGHV